MSDVHRHHPERVRRGDIAAGLLQAVHIDPPREIKRSSMRVLRSCRDCGGDYTVPADKATASSKWYSLCPSCLYWEI